MNKILRYIITFMMFSVATGQEVVQYQYNLLKQPIEENVLVIGYSHKPNNSVRIGAHGTQLRAGAKYTSVAADWSVLPLGTVFRIAEYGETNFVVDDHSADLLGKAAVKIYFSSPTEAAKFGSQQKVIQILRAGDYRASYLKLRETALTQNHTYAMAERIYSRYERAEKARQAAEELRLQNLVDEIEWANDDQSPDYKTDPLQVPAGLNPLFPNPIPATLDPKPVE